jgi:hypothetical protein
MVPTANKKEKVMLDMKRLSKRATKHLDAVCKDDQRVYNIIVDNLHGRRNTDTILVATGMVGAVMINRSTDPAVILCKSEAEWQADRLEAYNYQLSDEDYANILSAVKP